jgi:hypothetical protein
MLNQFPIPMCKAGANEQLDDSLRHYFKQAEHLMMVPSSGNERSENHSFTPSSFAIAKM